MTTLAEPPSAPQPEPQRERRRSSKESTLHARESMSHADTANIIKMWVGDRSISVIQPPDQAMNPVHKGEVKQTHRKSSLTSLAGQVSNDELQRSTLQRSEGYKRMAKALLIIKQYPTLCKLVCNLDRSGAGTAQYMEEIKSTAASKKAAWRLWGIPLRCTVVIGKCLSILKRRRSGVIVSAFVVQMAVQNRMHMAMKQRLSKLKQIQNWMRNWLMRERERRQVIRTIFYRNELEFLKRRWNEEDSSLARQEFQKLTKCRSHKEKKRIQVVIASARENVRKYTQPKSSADFAFIDQQYARFSMPDIMKQFCTQYAYISRRVLMQRETELHAQRLRVYEHELQTWQDIDQALKLIDQSNCNPAPPPIMVEKPKTLFAIDMSVAYKIVRKVHAWCDANKDLVKGISAPAGTAPLRSASPAAALPVLSAVQEDSASEASAAESEAGSSPREESSAASASASAANESSEEAQAPQMSVARLRRTATSGAIGNISEVVGSIVKAIMLQEDQ
eukprot:gnl/TRDRNA2_/TRDRNA2_176931_c2_seq3.p1 gnl/TRDRNA2_/TRDRNA2_176931_c2~~gnl/TRDRNA2_/TRDRNA2_176931_c2_seq3.p1  ORF type:complete len:506 (+),score=84.86 gnl/TRDRNA2_/TRDRNA2_176931_c2_seq3:1092-2609(+)